MGRHAYCIIAHNNPKQFYNLLGLLADERNDIYVHIDKKSDIYQFTAPFSDLNYPKNLHVFFIHNRVNVYWGHYSLIVCELNLLKAVSESPKKYDYVHLISGVDLPLKHQDEIHDFFDKHQGLEFIDFSTDDFNMKALKLNTEYPYYFGSYLSRHDWFAKIIGRNLFRIQRLVVKTLNIKSKYDVELYKGSNWFSITGNLAQWITAHRKIIIRTLKHTWCPDELMLQTFVMASPYKNNISSMGNLRAIDWTRGTPYVWRTGDFDELMKSHALFARKFSFTDFPEIIQQITNKLQS